MKRHTPLQRRKPMRRASTKRARELALYRKERDAWLLLNPVCDVCPGIWHGPRHAATQVHHTRGRIGRLLRMQEFWLAVCDRCHAWIHDNPNLARKYGLLAPSSEFNVVPK
jgi:hypothetical protein